MQKTVAVVKPTRIAQSISLMLYNAFMPVIRVIRFEFKEKK